MAPINATSPIPTLPPITVHLHSCPGTTLFSTHVPVPTDYLAETCDKVVSLLYASPWVPPPLSSISLHVRPLDGVAHTVHSHTTCTDGVAATGITAEIHLSATYLAKFHARNPGGLQHEIHGVLMHEMTHVWQCYLGQRAPHWIVEGVADYIRLRVGLAAEHWRKGVGGNWEDGYQTTGFFLDWIEESWSGFVVELTKDPCVERVEKTTGFAIEKLWESYQKALARMNEQKGSTPHPTHAVAPSKPTPAVEPFTKDPLNESLSEGQQ